MSPLPASGREPRLTDSARLRKLANQRRVRLRQPAAPPASRWKRGVARVKRLLHTLWNWGGWVKVAGIATALTAVSALYFSTQSLRSTEKQYELAQQGQVTDRFGKAVEQLGSDEVDVQLGGIYSLERLARDSPSDHSVIFEVLSAYVRTHSPVTVRTHSAVTLECGVRSH